MTTGTKTVPALCLWQPWASLLVSGVKSIETRSWSTRYRGRLLIHASAKRALAPFDVDKIATEVLGPRWFPDAPRGALVGEVELVDVFEIRDDWRSKVSPANWALGNFAVGRFAWVVRNAIGYGASGDTMRAREFLGSTPPPRAPIFYRGGQRLFYVPEEVVL